MTIPHEKGGLEPEEPRNNKVGDYRSANGVRCMAPAAPHGHAMQAAGNDAARPSAQSECSTFRFSAPQGVLHGPRRPDLLRDEVLADILESAAARDPGKTALICAAARLSYGELNQHADAVAACLIARGAGPGKIVGLWLPRGIDLLVAQAAIAKTGAAWLPFDADTPVERIAVCLRDADALGLATCDAFRARLDGFALPAWTREEMACAPAGPVPRARPGAADPAYVIYTSGSTGKPKGIAVSHGSICHFLRSENEILGIAREDVVYQGFSVAFDMSFEEIWISYLAGASLWVAPREVAGDPEAIPALLASARVTVLHAVPTMLALFRQDVPSLRLINLGGEMCPEALVARWAQPGRRMFNTYGPTEATVSASIAELRPGEPVTIGRPLPNYGMMVLDERQIPLAPGEVGELCIVGPGVAGGYLGRPELTAEKFLPNPYALDPLESRLYRTGDLARIDGNGRVQCLGRVDDQVKIRGFRVELGEIEAVLCRQPGVATAAVVVRQDQAVDQLVAYLVAEADVPPPPAALRRSLSTGLPPYMVPTRFEAIARLPRLPSGKIDRKALRALPLAPLAADDGSDQPANDAERVLFEALRKLFPGQPLQRGADFFTDLGGHSLFAARLASALRADRRFAGFTLGDVYRHRTLGKLAASLAALAEAAPTAPQEAPRAAPPPTLRRLVCGAAQGVALPILVGMRILNWLLPFFTYHYFTGDPGDSVPFAVLAAVTVYLLATALGFVLALAGKWLVIGRTRAGRYPLWGSYYFRWWLADRLLDTAPAYLLSGSSLYRLYLRALGARIGRDAMIGSAVIRVPDLLEIGDGASIGTAVNLENAKVEGGELVLGRIVIGSEAYVGSYAVLEGGTSIGAWGRLEGLSALAAGQSVPEGRIWNGAPARDAGAFDRASRPPRPGAGLVRRAAENAFFFLGAGLITVLFFLPIFPMFALIDFFDETEIALSAEGYGSLLVGFKYFVFALPASAVMVLCTVLVAAAVRKAVLPRLAEGSWPVHSFTYCGKWLVNQIQETSMHVLHGIYATVYAPFWYRMLGAKVGKDAEISTALGLVPDMLTLGDETFVADGVMLGDEEIDGGWMTLRPTVVSRRSFIGNGAYIPDGTVLPENVLIGVQSRAPDNALMHGGETWFGSPPINLPVREQVCGMPESLTFRPSRLRRLGRGIVEALRIVVPHAVVVAAGYTIVLAIMPIAGAGHWRDAAVALVVAGVLYGLGSFLFVAAAKWLLIGRYRTRSAPMWTAFVWLSEAVTNLYEGLAVPNFVGHLRGTPMLPFAMRLLGCKIGRGVYLDTIDITEFDCVSIGDYCEINGMAGPQTHLFEDRVMKIDHVRIGNRVTIAARATILYGAAIGDGASLGPMTLVMKGETIPGDSAWTGSPAAPWRR